MKEPSFSPFRSLLVRLGLLDRGRLHFPKGRLGGVLALDGETRVIFHQVIFRQVIRDPQPGQPSQPRAIFLPRFYGQGMSLRQNILFSWLPVPFCVGLPGFRSRLWLYHPGSGDFSGVYEWDSPEYAARCSRSFAAKFTTRRSVPGPVSFCILPAAQQQGCPGGAGDIP